MDAVHVVEIGSEEQANIHSCQEEQANIHSCRVVNKIKESVELGPWLGSLSSPEENTAAVDTTQESIQNKAAFSRARSKYSTYLDPRGKIRARSKYRRYLDPQVVSLGPHHHGKKYLEPMERKKEMAATRFAKNCQQEILSCYKVVEKVVTDAKASYPEEENGLCDQCFTRMMFLDGCFVADFIDATTDGRISWEVGRRQFPLIVRDMFLLENQLPLVVVEALLKLRFPRKNPKRWILRFIAMQTILTTNSRYHSLRPLRRLWWSLVRFCFGPPNSGLPHDFDSDEDFWWPEDHDFWCLKDQPSLHLLDMLRLKLLGISTPLRACQDQEHTQRLHALHQFGSVTELKEDGITVGWSDSGKMRSVWFERGLFFPKILLPPMVINEATISQIHNLLALELCFDRPSDTGVTSFLCLMDSLINHAADVKELRAQGILQHALGSDEDVAKLFNELPLDTVGDLPEFTYVKYKIQRHRRRFVRVSTARWLDTHFSNVWTTIALTTAILLLFFSAVQTVYTVFPLK